MTMTVNYYIDGYNIATVSAYISKSKGLIDTPALKDRLLGNWPGEHGEVVDFANAVYEPRTITLEGFIRAENWETMITNFATLMSKFRTGALQQLLVEVNTAASPLVAMVYLSDVVPLEKRFKAGEMIGVFTLKLIEAEPVKALYLPTGTAATIVLTSTHPVTVYWGDGAVSSYIAAAPITATHTYAQVPKDRQFMLITGRVEGFTGITLTNLTLVWRML